MKKGLQSRMHSRVRYLTKIALLMKLAFSIVFITCLQASATGYSQEARLSLDMRSVTIGKVLKAIEVRTDYHFVYASDLFPVNSLVNISVKEKPVSDILNLVLDKTGFTFRKVDDLIILTSNRMPDAQKELRGRVMASATGEPLAGVTVTVENTGISTATDAKGEFTIKAPDNGVLVISSVGYITQRVALGSRTEFNIVLTQASTDLNEIVVVGYGARKKKDIIGAVSNIGTAEIEKSTSITPELAMKGQMAGVSVTSAGGNPSARPTIRIRGVNTFNSADPLYVVDGIPLAEGGAGATTDKVNDPTRRSPINIYTIINPSDIESITVLKDASASAIYGVRAANGVILITTKSGKKGRVRVDFDGLYGVQKIPKTYKVLNTQQYTKFYTDAYTANPDPGAGGPLPISQAQYFGPVWDPTSPQYLGNNPTSDWQDAIINKNAKIRNYNVRASGGTENTTYNFSAGYANNDAPFKFSSTERYSISSNVNTRIGKYIETGINLRLIQENIRLSTAGTNDLGMYAGAPWQAIYDKTNPYGYAALYTLKAPITPTTLNFNRLWGVQFVPIGNYLGQNATSMNKYVNQSAIGSGFIQVQPIPGLKIKGTFSAQQYTLNNTNYIDFDNWEFGENPSNPYSGVANPQAGTRPDFLGTSSSTTTNTVKSLNGDYAHSFGKHNLDFTVDASQQEYTWKTSSANSHIFSSDPSLRYFNATGSEQASYALNGHYVLIGYLGRLSYNYNNRYYLEGVIRRDGSSRFAPGHQFGTFPSASAGWRISSEKFMKSLNFITDLKIRGGYGVLGNEQTTGGWGYLAVASVNPPSYNLGTGSQQNNLGTAFSFANSSLTWERLKSTNIGFDALLLNSITFTFDYYHKVTNGIIQSLKLTPSSGIEQPADINIADVLNRGFEFQLGYNKNFGQVGVSFSANLTTVHNEVLTLANHTAQRSSGYSATNLEEGQPIGFIYGYKAAGIFQDQKQIDAWRASHADANIGQNLSNPSSGNAYKPGDMYFQDLYGQPTAGSTTHNPKKDSVIDTNDQTILGKTIPGYYYGFSASANYKGWDISAFFQGVGDVQKYNSTRSAAEGMNGYGRNQWSTVLNAWTPQNHSTTMPRAVYNDPNKNIRVSSRWVESASYFRLQNLQIGYTFPKPWMDKTKALQSLRIYISGINLFTVTKYTGLDPENDNYPSTRQYLLGVKASF